MVEHGPDRLGLFEVEDRFDLDHAIFGVAAADVAALLVGQGVRVLTMALHEGVLARQLLSALAVLAATAAR